MRAEAAPEGAATRCRLCAGSGRIVLLARLFADVRLRSSFRTEECHFCRGTGESSRSWPEWEEEQAALRAARQCAVADS
ncbi:MAG: hypothetical protein OXP75_19905 [Rhodospirillales bacterium]|nr:hypothetical protein [Rhodospirillales bacterium]